MGLKFHSLCWLWAARFTPGAIKWKRIQSWLESRCDLNGRWLLKSPWSLPPCLCCELFLFIIAQHSHPSRKWHQRERVCWLFLIRLSANLVNLSVRSGTGQSSVNPMLHKRLKGWENFCACVVLDSTLCFTFILFFGNPSGEKKNSAVWDGKRWATTWHPVHYCRSLQLRCDHVFVYLYNGVSLLDLWGSELWVWACCVWRQCVLEGSGEQSRAVFMQICFMLSLFVSLSLYLVVGIVKWGLFL